MTGRTRGAPGAGGRDAPAGAGRVGAGRVTSWRELHLVCPRCRADLVEVPGPGLESALSCADCGSTYPVLLDIPDLRVSPDPYIGFEEDRAKARSLAGACARLPLAEALAVYYRQTSVVTGEQAAAFTASVLAAGDRARETLRHVERSTGRVADALLDLGCGTAPLAAAAAPSTRLVVGVDIAFRWLAMAGVRLREAGCPLPLVCACAEALPFPDGTFDRVIGESVIEHVEDQDRALGEAVRTLRSDGDLFLTTPNRFSLGPDPHVGLPAGGYLPDAWVAAWIRRRGGVPPRRRLLSDRALRRLVARAGLERIRIGLPGLPEARRRALRGAIRWAADAYEGALRVPPLRFALRKVGPLLSALAVKPARSASPDRAP